LLRAGAADTIVWNVDGSAARQVRARLERWTEIDDLAGDATRRVPLFGSSAAWSDLVRRVVEAARFVDTPILLIGESGTGKELLGRTTHMVDTRAPGRRLASW
jgi:DNA-binding NtrC family response regulator